MRTCTPNLLSDKHMNVQYRQTHSTASSARNHFTYSAKMFLAVLLQIGRWPRQPCSTLILRFSRALGYKTPRENWKSSNNWPPPPPNQCFSVFQCFSFLCRNTAILAASYFPFNSPNVLQHRSNTRSSCRTILMLRSNWRFRVIYFYSWGEAASLRNCEKRGMTVLCSVSAALKQDCLP